MASLGYQHHHQPFPDPRRIVPDIPEAVCQVLAKGAAKQAAERYPDAAVLVGALDGVLSGETATAARTDVPTPTPAAPPPEPTLIESPRPSPVTIPDAKLPAQPAAASRFGGRSFGRLVQDGIWRTVQRIDKLLARIAGEGNTLVHGFCERALAADRVVILLVIMPFVRSSVTRPSRQWSSQPLKKRRSQWPTAQLTRKKPRLCVRPHPPAEAVEQPKDARTYADRGWTSYFMGDYYHAVLNFSKRSVSSRPRLRRPRFGADPESTTTGRSKTSTKLSGSARRTVLPTRAVLRCGSERVPPIRHSLT